MSKSVYVTLKGESYWESSLVGGSTDFEIADRLVSTDHYLRDGYEVQEWEKRDVEEFIHTWTGVTHGQRYWIRQVDLNKKVLPISHEPVEEAFND